MSEVQNGTQIVFEDYVHRRIAKKNSNKKVALRKEGITIESERLLVMPCWKRIENVEVDAKKEIALAFELLNEQRYSTIYLVYPRSESFYMHTPVKIPKLNKAGIAYSLKIIPYKVDGMKIEREEW